MKYKSTLIVVADMEKSKSFYHDILGLRVIADFGANVTLTGGIALQTLETWKQFIGKADTDIVFSNNAGELYFEEDDIEQFAEKLEKTGSIAYVHKMIEHAWGQRVVRFYDPDRHIIEVGENLAIVIQRFIGSGLTIEETAKRMDIPVAFVRRLVKNVN